MRLVDVPSADGAQWIRRAWALYRRAPLQWTLVMLVWLAISLAVPLLLPIVAAAAILLEPGLFAGLMIACRIAEEGGTPSPRHIFAAFRVNARALVTAGFVMAVGYMLIVLLVNALGLPRLTLTADGQSIDFETFALALDAKLWVASLGLALVALWKGALWFVAPLLAFHRMSAGHAIRWSIYAFLSNFGAMACYAALITAIYFAALLPYGAGLLIALPVMTLSNYAAYKAVFSDDAEA